MVVYCVKRYDVKRNMDYLWVSANALEQTCVCLNARTGRAELRPGSGALPRLSLGPAQLSAVLPELNVTVRERGTFLANAK